MQKVGRKHDKLHDLISGMITALFVSPTNAILDRSVIEYANGKETIQNGVRGGLKRLFGSPVEFITSYKFRWMYAVYALTYSANNLTDHDPIIPKISIPIQNLMITFCVNTISGILKDKAYIQHFGASSPKSFPVVSLGLLFLRDIITMASAFTFPHIIAIKLKQSMGISQRKGLAISQLFSPLVVQILVTPLHLLGLDLYNRQGLKLKERIKYIKVLYPNTLALRMVRFLPAYGIGGVINNELRRYLKN